MKRFIGFLVVALLGVLSQVTPSQAVGADQVVSETRVRTASFANSMGASFASIAIVGASDTEFHYISTTCLAAAPTPSPASCTVTFEFTPKFEGRRTAQVRLYTDLSDLTQFQKIDLTYSVGGTCDNTRFPLGDGTSTNPYRISTAEQVKCINAMNLGSTTQPFLGKSFLLINDITLTASNAELPSIGSSDAPFTGSFDGGGHKIEGFEISGLEAGMFAELGPLAVVKNLEIVGANVTSQGRAGVLSVESEGAKVTNVHIIGGTVSSVKGWHVGGLIGSAHTYSEIKNSSSSASVAVTADATQDSCIGGFVGALVGNALIDSSYATGSVTYAKSALATGYASIGGMVGCAFSTSTISQSYAIGPVTYRSNFSVPGKTDGIGGFSGMVAWSTARNNMATGVVSTSGSNTSRQVGGFLGNLSVDSGRSAATLAGNLWDREKTGQNTDPANILAGVPGQVDPKTSAELTSLSTFTAAGWEFEAAVGSDTYWVLLPTSYPTLVNRPFLNVPGAVINPLAEPAALPTPQAPPTAYYSEPSYAPQASFTAKGRMTTLKRTSGIALEGGSGQGVVTYKSLTEAICAVDSNGVISGLSAGQCEVEVGKAADGFYLAATATMVVQILTPYQKLWQAPEGITSQDIQSIRGRYLSYLRSDLFQQLSTTALASLSSKQIKLITKRQFATLNQDQRKALKR